LVAPVIALTPKKSYNPKVKKYINLQSMSLEERNALIKKDPSLVRRSAIAKRSPKARFSISLAVPYLARPLRP
jgi:hypothetical protein